MRQPGHAFCVAVDHIQGVGAPHLKACIRDGMEAWRHVHNTGTNTWKLCAYVMSCLHLRTSLPNIKSTQMDECIHACIHFIHTFIDTHTGTHALTRHSPSHTVMRKHVHISLPFKWTYCCSQQMHNCTTIWCMTHMYGQATSPLQHSLAHAHAYIRTIRTYYVPVVTRAHEVTGCNVKHWSKSRSK
jgi:hypothetical protein